MGCGWALSLPEQKSRWFYIITRGLLSYTPKNFVILCLQNLGCKFNKIHQELVRQRPPPRIKMHLWHHKLWLTVEIAFDLPMLSPQTLTDRTRTLKKDPSMIELELSE